MTYECPPPIPPERRTDFKHKVKTTWTDTGLQIEVTESWCDSENFHRKSSMTATSYVSAPRELIVAALALSLASAIQPEA